MKITRDEVVHVADLARLELTDAEIDRFVGQIGQILDYMETLDQVDTGGVAPTSHAITLTNAFRADETVEHLDRESVTFQVRYTLFEAHCFESNNVFANNPSGLNLPYGSKHLRPECAVIVLASSLPGLGEWMAGKSSANKVN